MGFAGTELGHPVVEGGEVSKRVGAPQGGTEARGLLMGEPLCVPPPLCFPCLGGL